MGRVKDWMMDEEEKAAEYWLATHPGKTPEDAWYALHGDGQDDQQLMDEEQQNVY